MKTEIVTNTHTKCKVFQEIHDKQIQNTERCQNNEHVNSLPSSFNTCIMPQNKLPSLTIHESPGTNEITSELE